MKKELKDYSQKRLTEALEILETIPMDFSLKVVKMIIKQEILSKKKKKYEYTKESTNVEKNH